MADSQITAGGVKAAPLAYTIPGAQEIIVKAAYASFDCSLAAGDVLPCLRLIAPSGKVVGEYVTDEAVTAGNSAEVSWAPFLRNAGGAGTVAPAEFARLQTLGSVPANANITWFGFNTTSTDTFGTTNTPLAPVPPTNTSGDDWIVLLKQGIYLVELKARWTSSHTAYEHEAVADFANPVTISDEAALESFSTLAPLSAAAALNVDVWTTYHVMVYADLFHLPPVIGRARTVFDNAVAPAGTKIENAYMGITYIPPNQTPFLASTVYP